MALAALQAVEPWSSGQIHDTVAAITRTPAFENVGRQSFLGRVVRYVLAQIRDLLVRYQGSTEARYIVIASVILICIVVFARIMVMRQSNLEAKRVRLAPRSGSTSSDQWLNAERLAAAGDYAAACHALYAGVLARVALSGALSLHSSKTSGDYWRELRRRASPAAETFRAFARQFDRVMYGESSVGSADFAELKELAERVVLSGRRAA